MELNKLCIILPADFDEIDNQKPKNDTKIEPEKSSKRRSCGGQIIALIKNSLSELSESKWVNFCRHESAAAARGSFYDTEGTELTDKVGSDNPRIFSYSELYIGTHGFSEKELLGSGGFGRVYKATLPSDGSLVAVKCLAERGERFERTFVAELVAVAHLRHRNLVRLRGWCVNDGRLLLVYDYMPNRSLDRILFKRPEKGAPTVLGWDRRRRIVAGLASALFYLHEQLDTQIVHRDVKSSNVMLDSNYDARLGDFGLARWLEHGLRGGGGGSVSSSSSSVALDQFRLAETSKIGGTIGYLPPESFSRKGAAAAATAKSDVFSFGIVVLEVVSGRRAVDLTRPDDRIVLLDWVRRLSDDGKLSSAADRTLGAAADAAEVERLVHLALLCTLHDQNSRPSMKWVAGALSTAGGGLAGKFPPLPSFRSHPKYISLSSSSSSTAATTVTAGSGTGTALSSYVTANEDTIYSTAENSDPDSGPGILGGSVRRGGGVVFPMVHTPREISYDEIVAATEDFSDGNRVAEVDFGTAYRGVLAGQHVLVKRLGMKTCPALRDRFSAELQSLGRLRHRHLVQLRGWCTDRGEMLVVYDHGTGRRRQLSTAVRSGLTWRQRYNVIRSLASAVHYLHEEWDETVVHRSITSSAVVLDQDASPRLGSFALAEFLIRNEHGNHHIAAAAGSGGSVRGIFGYMAPEYVDSGEATTEADVYSFGVVVLEVVTGEMAVDFRRPEVLLVRRVQEFLGRRRAVDELADIRLGGAFDRRELERVVRLGTRCTGSHPESRPTMREIVRILDGNDEWFMVQGQNTETVQQWNQMNGSSLSLIKRIQALGIQ